MKKLIISLALSVCTMLSWAQFSGSGSGTESDPYLIFYADQLNQVRNFLNQEGVVFKLMSNIDLSSWLTANNPGQGWEPIGTSSAPFKGVFEGNNKTLTGFSINRTTDYIGLFGCTNGSTIRNLTIEGNITGRQYTGAFVGYATSGALSNLTHTGNTTGTAQSGGIVGYSTAAITNATVTGNLTSSGINVGGIVGCQTGNMSNCIVNGDVTSYSISTDAGIGGIVGKCDDGSLTHCTFSGVVTGNNATGGIVGYATNASIQDVRASNVVRRYNTNDATCIGGICGYSLSTDFLQCYSYCAVEGGAYTGGIVGQCNVSAEKNIISCFSFGDIVGSDYVGGIAGYYGSTTPPDPEYDTYIVYGYPDQCYDESALASLSSTETPSLITNCCVIGDIHASGSQMGGIVGSAISGYAWLYELKPVNYSKYNSQHDTNSGTTNSNGYSYTYRYYYYYKNGEENYKIQWTANVNNAPSFNYKEYKLSPTKVTIANSYYSGSIDGHSLVGGIAGRIQGVDILKNYSNASINGTNSVGGIVGQSQGRVVNSITFNSCIQSNMSINPSISGSSSVGRIYGAASNTTIGTNGNTTEDNRALYDTRVIISGVTQTLEDDAQNGVTNGNAYFKLKANYVSHGWDFNSDWTNQETETYPYKPWQTAPPTLMQPVSGSTNLMGQSVDGGTVYINIGSSNEQSVNCSGNTWNLNDIAMLKSGQQIDVYAKSSNKEASYINHYAVGFPGSGTEADPWRVYSGEDLQGVYKAGYYKQMNDIDLTAWINENSSSKGWVPIGFSGNGSVIYDGNNHTVSGLWINSTDDYTGLFSSFDDATIKNLKIEVSTRKVKGGNCTGVLAGLINGATIENITIKGDVQGYGYVGGVIGQVMCKNGNGQLKNISYTGSVTNTHATVESYLGGITGASSCEMVNCSAQATLTHNKSVSSGTPYVGGLVGKSDNVLMSCSFEGSITVQTPSSYVGGVTGWQSNVYKDASNKINMYQCTSNATISTTGNTCMCGGLVGAGYPRVQQSKAAGLVTAMGTDSYAGGLIGKTEVGSTIINCYATAKASATLYAAGLVAYNYGSINKSYAAGDISSTYYGAGTVGYNDGIGATTTNCVALGSKVEVSDQTGWGIRVLGGFKNGAPTPDENNYGRSDMQISVNGVPKSVQDNILDGQSLTPAQTKQQASYTAIDWDFADIWTIEEGNGYPILQWETETTPTTDIALNKVALTMEIGNSETLTAMVQPTSASNQFTWTSSNTAVATIENGVVTAVAIGMATIIVATTDGTGLTATCQVTVTANKSEAIANLQSLVAEAQSLYNNSTEGDEPGQYQSGARAALLAVITSVNSRISNDMSFDDIAECTEDINAAIATFYSMVVSAGEDTDISLIDNVIYMDYTEASAGTEQTLSIKMKNTDGIQTVQFDLYLPDGVEVVLDEDDYELIELSLERTTARKMDQFSAVLTSGGAYRVLINSTRGNTFDGNDGEIVTARVKLADDMAAGDYPLIFKDIVLVNTSSVGYRTDYVKCTLSVDDYILGDVNNDKAVDAIDLNAITNYILERRTFPFTFNVKAGDVNGDSVIDAIDLNAVTNMILHDSQAGAKPRAVVVGRIDN